MVQIETSRLILRPLTANDDVALFRVVGDDPDMTWDKTSRSLERVRKTLHERIEHYNEVRPHSSLRYLTPKEFAESPQNNPPSHLSVA